MLRPRRCRGALARRLPPNVAAKAAKGAAARARIFGMTDDHDLPAGESPSATGSTAYLLQEMQLYGHRPFEDEPDPRPLPDDRLAGGAIADMFDGLTACLIDTRIEPDLEDLLWNLVNIFHRAGERVERELDRNEQAQRTLQREQDGSEIRSVELERTTAEGITMIERRDTMEFFRECAAEQFRTHARKAWTPRTGSRVRHNMMTAAVIDSRDFMDRRLREKAVALLPEGTRIAFSGGPACNDHQHIWSALDRIHSRHPDMILLHGATPTGAERAAACWADTRGVQQVAFRPDWNRHKKAAPFKRNDRMIEAMPVGLVVFSGTGIQDNLVDKARAFGIPVWDFRLP
jgi:hypothetical protein